MLRDIFVELLRRVPHELILIGKPIPFEIEEETERYLPDVHYFEGCFETHLRPFRNFHLLLEQVCIQGEISVGL